MKWFAIPLLLLSACLGAQSPTESPRCGDGVVGSTESCDDGNEVETDACLNNCEAANCGDGLVHAGEEACDDGNGVDNDGCRNNCEAARCGDGLWRRDLSIGETGFEACDDGNEVETDHCLSDCVVPRCGDGHVYENVELCDDGNEVETDACLSDCSPAACGDGVKRDDLNDDDEGFEACDDGNTEDGDACLNNCEAASCGDGVQRQDLAEGEAGYEACDDGNDSDADACLTGCIAAVCGDGLVNVAVEDCDDQNEIEDDACRSDCRAAACGDGILRTDRVEGEAGYEACDDGNLIPFDACLDNCQVAYCGDGQRQEGHEGCDDGNDFDDDDCINCEPSVCGDGFVREGLEQCDDANDVETDACLNNCVAASCGDGHIHEGEEYCDDQNAVDDDACGNDCVLKPCPGGNLAEPEAQWAHAYVGENTQHILSLASAADGSLLFAGQNRGIVDFGGNALDSQGNHGIFVVKLDADGEHLWSWQQSDEEGDSEPHGIAVDSQGAVLVTGYVKGTFNFGGGPVAPTVAGNLRELFVFKLSSAGGFLWARRFGAGRGQGIAIGPDDRVVVTGEFNLSANDFGDGAVQANGQGDIFLLRLNSDGESISYRTLGGPSLDYALAVAVDDDGSVALTGGSYGGIDFGDGAVGQAGISNLWILKVDANNQTVFSFIQAAGSATGHALAFAPDGGLVIKGNGRGAVDLGGGALGTFVAKLDGAGNHLWSRNITASLWRGLAVDPLGSVWLNGAIDLAPAGCQAPAQGELILLRLKGSDGSLIQARSALGDTSLQSLTVAPNGDLITTGFGEGAGVDLGTGAFPALNGRDVIIVRYQP